MPLASNLKNALRSCALTGVELIVSFKRATEKLLLPDKWRARRVKPAGSIAREALLARFPRYLRLPKGGWRVARGGFP